MPARPDASSSLPSAEEGRTELRKRVSRFVRSRREQLGLRPIDMSRAMGYRSANSIVNVEAGIEGIPAKRAYAWADLLEVPRDAFFQFITGQIRELDTSSSRATAATPASLAPDEKELLVSYRRLPPASRVLVRELATKLAEAPRRRR